MEPSLVFRPGLSHIDYTNNYFFNNNDKDILNNDEDILECYRGNPHNILPGYIKILQNCAVPPNNKSDYYKYNNQKSFQSQRERVAKTLNKNTPLKNDYKWTIQNIMLTTGALPALYMTISTLCCPGDEIIVLKPYYQNYPKIIRYNGGKMIIVEINMNNHTYNHMDIIESINNAITPKTKAIILNTPHNPVGVMFSDAELKQLSVYLNRKSMENKQRIWIISDEPYRDVVLSHSIKYKSPSIYYEYTCITYSYAKILLSPGQRLGWIAIPSTMKLKHQKEIMRRLLYIQWFSGVQMPNTIPAFALIELEELIDKLKKDIINDVIERNNLVYDTLCKLKKNGYFFKNKPLATYYFMFKPPLERYGLKDAKEFVDLLIKVKKLRLRPLGLMGMDNWVRISYTNGIHDIRECCRRLLEFDTFLQMRSSKKQSKL